MIYEIQQRVETLAHNAVAIMDEDERAAFSTRDIRFSHVGFRLETGWKQNYWLAKGNIEASHIDEAYRQFNAKLAEIVPKVALISQCYTQYLNQPFLIHRDDLDVAFLKYRVETKGVGLMFREGELKALNLLLAHPEIPEEFYYYWNDAVNSVGYSSKLALMMSAIEALASVFADKDKEKEKYYKKIEEILGPELKLDLFGTKGSSDQALRNRLVHGEYFNQSDSGKDYVGLVHKKIICYFNDGLFKEKLINEKVVRPQRHFVGNTEEGSVFLRSKGSKPLDLVAIMAEADKTDLWNLPNYELIYDDKIRSNY
jgi:hypothetical protein